MKNPRTVTVRLELQTTEPLGTLRSKGVWQATMADWHDTEVMQASAEVAQPPKQPKPKKAPNS